MPRTKDKVGQRFGMLTVIAPTDRRTPRGDVIWECLCDCGNVCYRKTPYLIQRAKSCGCLLTKHGLHDTAEYHAWEGMVQRCTNPRAKDWPRYGGRGITVAPEFRDFQTWLAHIGQRPGPEYTQDRTDNDRGYEPGNVRWATRTTQNRNQRRGNQWHRSS